MVIILGIMAGIVVPQFSNATIEAKESMLRADLHMVREQIHIYYAQHDDTFPGYDADSDDYDSDTFLAHLTQHTNIDGDISEESDDDFDLGPYLREIPDNPMNGLDSVLVITHDDDIPEEADDSSGWIYIADDSFWSFAEGADADGQFYYEY